MSPKEARPPHPFPASKGEPMTWAMSPPADTAERYLLRDLVWCGPCGMPMEPAMLSPNKRFYGCPSIHCPRPVIPAEILEILVWQAFVYLFAEVGPEISAEEQRAALVHSLERVTVGADLGELRYQWRDLP